MTTPHVHGPDCDHDHGHDHDHSHATPDFEVESSVKMTSTVEGTLQVAVPWEFVQKKLQKSYKEVAKHARVRGFRQGKAPMNVIKQMYGKRVREEVSSHLVELGLLLALQKHELDIVAQPEIHADPIKQKESLRFTAKIETRPKIEKVETGNFKVEKPVYEVDNADITRELEALRLQHADVRTPEPMRPAKEHDILKIAYTVSLDGENKDDLAAEDREVSLGTDDLAEEFEAGLIGTQPGNTKTIEMTMGDNHPNKELRGKKTTFEVTVKELKERLLPQLDDDFAKDVGDYETLLDLRLKTRERLEKLSRDQSEAALKRALIDKLIELNPIEVPPSLRAHEQQQSLYQMASYAYMSQQPFDAEDAQEAAKESGERRVQAALLLGALAKQEDISFTPEDVEAKFTEIAEATGKHLAKVKAEYADRRDAIENEVLEEKLIGHLHSIAEVSERRINDENDANAFNE